MAPRGGTPHIDADRLKRRCSETDGLLGEEIGAGFSNNSVIMILQPDCHTSVLLTHNSSFLPFSQLHRGRDRSWPQAWPITYDCLSQSNNVAVLYHEFVCESHSHCVTTSHSSPLKQGLIITHLSSLLCYDIIMDQFHFPPCILLQY